MSTVTRTAIKAILVFACWLLIFTGCCAHKHRGSKCENARVQQLVLNNTGYLLDVTQDGCVIGQALTNGQTVAIVPRLFVPRSVVTVTARNATGGYVGADTWVFCSGLAEVWRVDHVRRPQESR